MGDDIYDVIIVGAGAAGLSSAIYTARRNLKTLVISQDIGGQAATAHEIENYPGFDLTDGPSLMQKFQRQAEKFGAVFMFNVVTGIAKQTDGFTVQTANETYTAHGVILAFGLTHRRLGVPGEEPLVGHGVSYCSTCDGPLFKGKEVAVIGGGGSAVETALYLATICTQVYLIHRRDQFTAEAVMLGRLKTTPNIELILNAVTQAIKGQDSVEAVVIQDAVDPTKTREIKVAGVFVEIGLEVNADLVKGLVDLDERNQIKITPGGETSCPGIFAAGDVTTMVFKQVVISAGEGAKAALSCYHYLQKKQGQVPGVDWGSKKSSTQ